MSNFFFFQICDLKIFANFLLFTFFLEFAHISLFKKIKNAKLGKSKTNKACWERGGCNSTIYVIFI
jgi:hypothetical protein